MLHKQDPEVNYDIYDNMNSIVTYVHMSLSVSLTQKKERLRIDVSFKLFSIWFSEM